MTCVLLFFFFFVGNWRAIVSLRCLTSLTSHTFIHTQSKLIGKRIFFLHLSCFSLPHHISPLLLVLSCLLQKVPFMYVMCVPCERADQHINVLLNLCYFFERISTISCDHQSSRTRAKTADKTAAHMRSFGFLDSQYIQVHNHLWLLLCSSVSLPSHTHTLSLSLSLNVQMYAYVIYIGRVVFSTHSFVVVMRFSFSVFVVSLLSFSPFLFLGTLSNIYVHGTRMKVYIYTKIHR